MALPDRLDFGNPLQAARHDDPDRRGDQTFPAQVIKLAKDVQESKSQTQDLAIAQPIG
ncbi:MAG: hypothetical protein Q8922_07620 [Bacteroidota bacterium]|nr:hypothetical protein [Bacteroidota bacterium]MDP4287791.1 hypothetical protein [Bacteroidota bacterium]